jgi:beta-xylosidase
VSTDGSVRLGLTVANTGERAGTDVVQLYLHDPAASVTRPVVKLIGFTRVSLEPGARAAVEFEVPADVTSFVGLHLDRIVEPGALELRISRSSADAALTAAVELTGPVRTVDSTRRLHCGVTVRG